MLTFLLLLWTFFKALAMIKAVYNIYLDTLCVLWTWCQYGSERSNSSYL